MKFVFIEDLIGVEYILNCSLIKMIEHTFDDAEHTIKIHLMDLKETVIETTLECFSQLLIELAC